MKLLNVLTGAFICALSVSLSAAFQSQNAWRKEPSLCQASRSDEPSTMSRSQWLQTAGGAFAAAVMTAAPVPAFAKEDPALKGTKKDPEFEACLSQCMYDCTKPKGAEQKSRSECLPECKTQCAKTKAQLMKGTPIQQS